ncbi:MAG: hypothetical protein JRJ75_02960 [Deltaproteobacteria bacterium]|nr:hypothetical protein [Deltaproteobacteria bacterium]
MKETALKCHFDPREKSYGVQIEKISRRDAPRNDIFGVGKELLLRSGLWVSTSEGCFIFAWALIVRKI